MRKLFLLLAMVVPGVCFGADRWTALSMLESGDNDRAIGRAGEISRYQIMKAEWSSVTPSRRYTDPEMARTVAAEVMNRRLAAFTQVRRREPTNFEFYVLWNAPQQALQGRVTRRVAERAQRFENLCALFSQPVRLYASRQ